MNNIRKYKPADQDELIALWARVFPNNPAHSQPAAFLNAKLAVDDLIFVAEHHQSKTLVGACMAGYDGHRGWLYAVAVLPENRRDGTGSALVKHALDALKAIGCIKVNLQVRAGNTQVAEFYSNLGFQVEERLSMGRLLIDNLEESP